MDVKNSYAKTALGMFMICLIALTIGSCKKNKKPEKIPSAIVGRDTMVQILAELHLLESSLGIRIFEERKMLNTRNTVKLKIYENYGITKQRFFNSYDYYAFKAEVIDTLFTDVISELTKRQAEEIK